MGLKLIYAVVVLVLGYIIVHWGIKMLRKSTLFQKMNKGLSGFIISLLKVILYALIIIWAASIIGAPQSSILSILASVGVAVGLALQGALSNVAGGIILLASKPFQVGDYITAQGISGNVSDINILYTTVTSVNQEKITLPNGTLTNGVVVNRTANKNIRVDFSFQVAYGSNNETVKACIKDAAKQNPFVAPSPKPFIALFKMNNFSLEYVLQVYCDPKYYWDVYYSITENVKNNFEEHGIRVPYPQMDVHLDK